MKSIKPKHLVSGRNRQRGVNLIEIMVAMVIGLFLVAGAATLYVNTRKTTDVDDSIARLQETSRYALSVIESDVRMANYWGSKKDASDLHGIPKENAQAGIPAGAIAGGSGAADCGAEYTTNASFYIEATNNQYNLACAANTGAVTSADTLTVRRAGQTVSALDTSKQQVVSTLTCGELVIGVSKECPGGSVHDMIVHGYYVDQQSDQNPNIPSLRRKTLGTIAGTPSTPGFRDIEIVPGVEDMQIELGWDSSSDTTEAAKAVSYLQPENPLLTTVDSNGVTVPSGRVVSVRVWLLIRADTPDPTFTDTRTYVYGDRTVAAGTVSDISAANAGGKAYVPNDHFRRILVSRTWFVRNITGT